MIDKLHYVLDTWKTDAVRVDSGRVYVRKAAQWRLIGTLTELLNGDI